MTLIVRPGDVLLVRHPTLIGRLIRLGAGLLDKPNEYNHVIVADHTDAAGTPWGVEGRPGGVGFTDLTAWLGNPWTVANSLLDKSDVQRDMVCAVMRAMVTSHVGYSYVQLVKDALAEVEPIWSHQQWGPLAPGHVVCSNAADLAYKRAGLPNPPHDQSCTPWDWYEDHEQAWRRTA